MGGVARKQEVLRFTVGGMRVHAGVACPNR